MKSGDKTRIKVLNDIIVLVQKEQTKGKTKIEATEAMVAACATKAQKTLEEMVATCPGSAEYAERLADYTAQLIVAREYAPQLITDEDFIRTSIKVNLETAGIEIDKKNRGQIMKLIMPMYKGKADMKIVNQVIGEILK